MIVSARSSSPTVREGVIVRVSARGSSPTVREGLIVLFTIHHFRFTAFERT